MSDLEDIKTVLIEIREQQRVALDKQDQQLELARAQLERARSQVEESIGLQREAMAKQRTVMRIAVPGIVACFAAILYLIVRYF